MLSQEAFDFINNNRSEDVKSLALKTHRNLKDSMGFLLNQIKLRQKTKKKLPTWYQNTRLLFPTNLSSEQCSSEITAEYKASLFSGDKFIDLTGGMGIDTLAFSKNFKDCTYIEENPELASVAKHNYDVLGSKNIKTFCTHSIDYLQDSEFDYDLIFIDPDRRPTESRVYDFEDSLPNILEHKDLLLSKSKKVLIKASPMCDISACVDQLEQVTQVYVVSHKNECKEILFLLENVKKSRTLITAIELGTSHQLTVDFPIESHSLALTGIQKYIYDPFVAFRKAGMVEVLGNKENVTFINSTSSIFTSNEYLSDFPGRIFKHIETIAADKKTLKKRGIKRANIITRGFFLSSDQLHLQLKIGRGGNTFLIANKNSSGSVELIVCEKY